ncbi:MAG: T9SS type A sorting domain-containing protein [Candidatus Marinimicrobia bacterium]|nr:T9SS type A sorting domain-containing protein [Candidatus Neomarinimicrobiota bacterium]
MKKILMTLLLAFVIVSVIFAATGTVTLYYDNGTVSYTDTQTFYEFDVLAYISSGNDTAKFQEGQIYVEYDTTIYGSSVVANNKLTSITLKGPLSAMSGPVALYAFENDGADTYADAFSLTFTGTNLFNKDLYGSDTYISNSSGALETLMTIKLEVAASGTSVVDWPSSVTGINSLFRELEDGSTYDLLSTTNATETTSITYSNTGDPVLPITLEKLSVQYEDSKVVLSWTTESETQNLGYIIKRAIRYSENDYSPYEVIASYQDDDRLYGAGTTTEQNIYSYYDEHVKPGVNYSYILEDVDYDGNVVSHGPVSIIIPDNLLFENTDFKLSSSFPNPFNPSFTIPFELLKAMDVKINMYDITGRQVMTIVNGFFTPRQYQFRVNTSDLNSGIYFVRTMIGNEIITQKMTLLK